MYNLHYVPTTLGVQSRREIISGGTRTKKVEYHCFRVLLSVSAYIALPAETVRLA
jgi:hypothetical protein